MIQFMCLGAKSLRRLRPTRLRTLQTLSTLAICGALTTAMTTAMTVAMITAAKADTSTFIPMGMAANVDGADSNRPGSIYGSCHVTDIASGLVGTYEFNIGPGQKAALGIPVTWAQNNQIRTAVYTVEVVNNVATAYEQMYGAATIGVTRPPTEYEIKPQDPALCPTAIPDVLPNIREFCQLGQLLHPPPPPPPSIPTDAFYLVRGEHSGKDMSMPHLWYPGLPDGAKLSFSYVFQNVIGLSCSAVFQIQ
jgi:hypothetical protein